MIYAHASIKLLALRKDATLCGQASTKTARCWAFTYQTA